MKRKFSTYFISALAVICVSIALAAATYARAQERPMPETRPDPPSQPSTPIEPPSSPPPSARTQHAGPEFTAAQHSERAEKF